MSTTSLAAALAATAAFAGGGHAVGGHHEIDRAAVVRAAPSVTLKLPEKAASQFTPSHGALAALGVVAAGVLLFSRQARAAVAQVAQAALKVAGRPLARAALAGAAVFGLFAVVEARDLDWLMPAAIAGGLLVIAAVIVFSARKITR
jgi:hypothetical protein